LRWLLRAIRRIGCPKSSASLSFLEQSVFRRTYHQRKPEQRTCDRAQYFSSDHNAEDRPQCKQQALTLIDATTKVARRRLLGVRSNRDRKGCVATPYVYFHRSRQDMRRQSARPCCRTELSATRMDVARGRARAALPHRFGTML
jgi:hypothetical protein